MRALTSLLIISCLHAAIIAGSRIKRNAEIIEVQRNLAIRKNGNRHFDPLFGVPLAEESVEKDDSIDTPQNYGTSKETTDNNQRNELVKATTWNINEIKETTKSEYSEKKRQTDNEISNLEKVQTKKHETMSYEDKRSKARFSNVQNIKEYILSNKNILREIERNSTFHNAVPILRCKKFCLIKSSCCKIVYKKKEMEKETSFVSRAFSSQYVPTISKGLTFAGTVGLAIMGLSYFGSRDAKSSFLSEPAQYHFDESKKVMIESNDELWIQKLENYVVNDSELKEVDSFICCINIHPKGGMECYPQKRKKSKTRYRSQFSKLDITCKSGLSYNIAINVNLSKT